MLSLTMGLWTSYSTWTCMIGLTNFYLVIVTSASEEFRFTKKPGNFTVLQNTTAVFDWRHTVLDDDNPDTGTTNRANIVWTYKGRTNEQAFTLMSYSVEHGTNTRPSDRSKRLHHSGRTGSAAIQLYNVTSKDDGFYKVQVTDRDTGDVLRDMAYLQTVKLSEFWFNVTVELERFNLSISNNGTNITLGILEVSVPETVHVKVVMNEKIPVTDTTIVATVNDRDFPEHSCGSDHLCERGIRLLSEKDTEGKSEVVINIKFSVQNINPVQVRVPLSIQDTIAELNKMLKLESKNKCAGCWAFGGLVALGMLILAVLTGVFCKRLKMCPEGCHQRQGDRNHSGRELVDTSTSEP